jgi:hypothetical protein
MKKLVRRLGAVLVATAAIVGMTAVVSAPAQAAGDAVYSAKTNGYFGYAEFFSDGDQFTLQDTGDDGHGVVLHINLSNDRGQTYYRWKNLYNGHGYTTLTGWSFASEFPEGRYLAFSVCSQNGINQASYHCGAWTKATA